MVELAQTGAADGLYEILELRATDGLGGYVPATGEGTGPEGAHGGD